MLSSFVFLLTTLWQWEKREELPHFISGNERFAEGYAGNSWRSQDSHPGLGHNENKK